MDMEEEVLNPYSWVSGPVVLFYIYGFKPFGELMSHYFICEAQWVSGASDSSYVPPILGVCMGPVTFPASMVFVEPWSIFSLSIR